VRIDGGLTRRAASDGYGGGGGVRVRTRLGRGVDQMAPCRCDVPRPAVSAWRRRWSGIPRQSAAAGPSPPQTPPRPPPCQACLFLWDARST
jgi:hypothetical protein